MTDWRDPGECEHPQRYVWKDPCGCLRCDGCNALLELCKRCSDKALTVRIEDREVPDELAFNDELGW